MNNLEKVLKELKNVSTKEKRKMLCRELLKNRKIKEYIRLKRATDEEVEQVFQDLYKPFLEEVVTESDYEQ